MAGQSLGLEKRLAKVTQVRPVKFLERGNLIHSFQKPVLPLPRVIDAQLLAFFLRAPHLAKRMILIPWNELKQLRERVQIQIKILPRSQQSIHIRQPDRDRHIPRELIQIDILAQPRGELGITRLGTEFGELHDPFALLALDRLLRVISLIVFRPVRAQVGKQRRRYRLEERTPFGAEMPLRKMFVHSLADRVEAQIFSLKFARHSHIHPRISRARRWNSRVPVKPVGQHLVHQHPIRDVVLQIDRRNSVEFVALGILSQINLERSLHRPARLQKRAVSLVTNRHVRQVLPLKFQVGVDIHIFNAHRRGQPVALAFRPLKNKTTARTAGAAWPTASTRSAWSSRTAPRPSAPRRATGSSRPSTRRRCHDLINAGANLVGVQFPALIRVPRLKPLPTQRGEFHL